MSRAHQHRLRQVHVGLCAGASTAAAGASEPPLCMRLSSGAEEQWDPAATALIVCDMWNLHPCLNVRPASAT